MDVFFELPVLNKPSVVCLGNFDGVHKGHQHLIKEAVKCAKGLDLPSVVMTFEPHPELVLNPKTKLKKILTNQLKAELIGKLGVDILIYLPFNKETASMSPKDFITKILKQSCKASHIFAGFNYTFGKGAAGNVNTLQQYSSLLDYNICIVPPFKINEDIVSSSLIRKYLELGKIEGARELLGYWPKLHGRVIHGEERGRKLGFPTANIQIEDEIILPANGVYASLVDYQNKTYWGMTNIGIKPTIGVDLPKTIEINIFDFAEQIYNKNLTIHLVKYIRTEKNFTSLEGLRKQLIKDQKVIRNYLQQTCEHQESLV